VRIKANANAIEQQANELFELNALEQSKVNAIE
jgi:hypothetical protein